MLSRYLYKATHSHVAATKYTLKYLKSTINMGIVFSSKNQLNLEYFIKFPTIQSKLVSFIDANWGP